MDILQKVCKGVFSKIALGLRLNCEKNKWGTEMYYEQL